MQKILSFVLIVLLATFIGCKKNESSPTSSSSSVTIPTVTFKGPTATEAHAQTANSYAQTMTGLLSASTSFRSLPATTNGNVSSWTINAGTYTWTFTGTKQSDGSYTWTWVVNGTIENVTYDHWTYWSGTTSADGKNGSWSFYEYGTTHSVMDLNYTTVNGVLTGTWMNYTAGVLAEKFVIINNADNSGEFDMYSDGTTLYEKVTWTASETGTWATYNPAANGTF